MAAVGGHPAVPEGGRALCKREGGVRLARLARKLDVSEIDVTQAFTRLGETLGSDWVQSTAARMVPSDPWERLLVSGVARDLQQIRLDFLREAKGKEIGRAHV